MRTRRILIGPLIWARGRWYEIQALDLVMVKIENMGLEEFEGGMVNGTKYIALCLNPN